MQQTDKMTIGLLVFAIAALLFRCWQIEAIEANSAAWLAARDSLFFAIRENLDESHLDTIDESRSVNRVAREKVRPGKIVKIDINIDGIGKLQSLPGIGPALAARIVRLREQSGPFSSHEDLLRVKGIGPKKLAKIKPFLQSLTPLPGQ